MKSLTIGLLALVASSSTGLARGDGAMQVLRPGAHRCDGTIKVLNHRARQLVVWVEMVRVAEEKYKSTHGHYAELGQLRKASLLDEPVFESDSTRRLQKKSAANNVPTNTIFELVVSSDGHHFRASVRDREASAAAGDRGGWSINGQVICAHPQAPILDGPQGPAIESKRQNHDLWWEANSTSAR